MGWKCKPRADSSGRKYIGRWPSRESGNLIKSQWKETDSPHEDTISELSRSALNRTREEPDPINPDAGLEDIFPQAHSQKIGTLSFPVCKYGPIHNNTRRIEETLRRRHPALLLCAGWSVPSHKDLNQIVAVTNHVKSVVVLETPESPPTSFRICGGDKFPMGKQFFGHIGRDIAEKLCSLDRAMPARSFTFGIR